MPHMSRLTRYSLGEKIDLMFIELAELILIAGYAKRENKLPLVQKTSVKLDVLKFLLQTAWEMGSIENKKFAELTEKLAQVGLQLGGWQRQLVKETPSQ